MQNDPSPTAQPPRILPTVLTTLLLFGLAEQAVAAASVGTTAVDDALLTTWIHGVTPEIASREVGAEGIPVLLARLQDPAFPRRDNVVAFLAMLGDEATVAGLRAMLEAPPGAPSVPEEDRALLLVPQALGQLAARGHPGALELLLDVTAEEPSRDLLWSAAARADRPAEYRQDLLRSATWGLAWAASNEAARVRLEDVARDDHRPDGAGDGLTDFARSTFRSFGLPLPGGRQPWEPAMVDPAERFDPTTRLDFDRGTTTSLLPAVGVEVRDTALTFANHPDVASPLSDVRIDEVLVTASLHVGRSDFADDAACCVTFSRDADVVDFGSAGDGLDTIDDPTELSAVLNDATSRLKVVRAINWCGAPGNNIIGCAWNPGHGGAIVRLTNPSHEALLWVHEYGHNTGLGHNTDSRYVMFGTLTGANNGIEESMDDPECSTFQDPDWRAQATLVATGACTDADADGVHGEVDNCPNEANTPQDDTDADGVGDACDPCPLDAPPHDDDGDGVCDSDDACPGGDDSLDSDGDGIPDACDNCQGGTDDTDQDGIPDACDPCPLDAPPEDVDGDGTCNSDDACPGFDDTIDADGDGVPDGCDACPGSDDGQDADQDGVPDACDACPLDAPPEDVDQDGTCNSDDTCPGGDDRMDADADGVPDACDACPQDAPPEDVDGDGTCNSNDTCPGGDDAVDTDGDGVPDACDACPQDAPPEDVDGDGTCNADDACPGSDDGLDGDGDGTPDGCDPCPLDEPPHDDDGDGVCDSDDACPGGSDFDDADADGVADACDPCPLDPPPADDDGDGTCDSQETVGASPVVMLTADGAVPPLSELHDGSCGAPVGTLCTPTVHAGPLTGLVLADEARVTGDHSLVIYLITEDGLTLRRQGDDLAFVPLVAP